MFSVIYIKIFRWTVAGLVDDAKSLYPPVEIKRLKFHVPLSYVSSIDTSLELLRIVDYQALQIIVNNLQAVYAVNKPKGIGAASGVAFIDSTHPLSQDNPEIWIDLIGYLFHQALVCQSVARGQNTAVFKWSRIRRQCDRKEMSLKSRLAAATEGQGQ